MTQLAIQFDTLARRSDPISSKSAALEVVVTGIAANQRNRVFAALQQHGPATSRELAQASGLDRFVVARRLPELLRRGLVTRSEKPRECRAGGLPALEWSVK
jgi:predicted transcriptional regulator